MRHQLPLKFFDEVAKAGSIRKAADRLAITPSALNRRILSIEEELGVELFERIPSGVRLSAAGELMIPTIRRHMADMDNLRSSLADLAGERRGHVSIGCGQALLPTYLPPRVNQYRQAHPAVTFSVCTCGRNDAGRLLANYEIDLALQFEPELTADMTLLHSMPQQIHALVRQDHPLANENKLRLYQCADWPMLLPSTRNSIRMIVEHECKRRRIPVNRIIDSDSFSFLNAYLQHEDAIAFQIPIGLENNFASDAMIAIPLDERDLPTGNVVLSQLKGRSLPVAAAKFADRLTREMEPQDETCL